MAEQDIIKLTSDLIQSAIRSDWETLPTLRKNITSLNRKQRVIDSGDTFHKHYFSLENQCHTRVFPLSCPHVFGCGDIA